MNIPKGYKQTEINVLPENWEIHFLAEKATKIGSGITPTGGAKVYKKQGRPFLRSQNVGWGQLLLEDIAYIDDITHESFKGTEIREHDVFLNITGASIGRSAIADKRVVNGNVNQHVCIIRPVEKELNPYFLNCFLLSKNGQKQIDAFQAGGNRQGLNFGQIKSIKIPLPPTIEEQKTIAQSLSDIDALITALDQLITKKRNIRQSTMQQLLTGKKRLPGFNGEGYKHTEVGIIPEDWTVLTIGEIASISVGKDVNEAHFSTEQDAKYKYPVYSNTVDNEGLYGYYDYAEFNGNSLTVVGRGVGLGTAFSRSGSYGAIGRLVVVFPKKHCDNRFLANYINHEVDVFRESSGVPQLTGIGLAKYKVALPLLLEQKAIAQVLSDMDAEIEALEQKRDKYKAIKQGMMQELLTGKTRLISSS